MALWNRINNLAANYGETYMPFGYLRIRYEDLCATPIPIIKRVFQFFGLTGEAKRIAENEVSPPNSIGRWHALDKATQRKLNKLGSATLQRFGY